jgi:hypothetical protein
MNKEDLHAQKSDKFSKYGVEKLSHWHHQRYALRRKTREPFHPENEKGSENH